VKYLSHHLTRANTTDHEASQLQLTHDDTQINRLPVCTNHHDDGPSQCTSPQDNRLIDTWDERNPADLIGMP
jgi:uncharacterized protein HemX